MFAPHSLGDYLKILYDQDDLQRVAAEVNPELEIASIVDRIFKGQGRN